MIDHRYDCRFVGRQSGWEILILIVAPLPAVRNPMSKPPQAARSPVGRKMIVCRFLGWPILGCRPTSDCRSNPCRKANASITNPSEPLRGRESCGRELLARPLEATRPQNPNAARLGPGGAFFVAGAIFTAQ
jgi:hypothetical protein